MKNNNTIPALNKAIKMLEYLGQTENGVSQVELAESFDITPSTCYRILQTLLAHNWVCQKPGNLYDISNGILNATTKLINNTARFECLQPILEELAKNTGLSCKLSIRQADKQITILRAESPAPMSISGKIGVRFPIVEGSTGTALLCDEAMEEIQCLLNNCLDDIEEKKSPELINKRLDNLKEDGFCMNAQQNRWNVESMAAPIRDKNGKVIAAITSLGFIDDFAEQNIKALAKNLKKATLESSKII